MRRPPCGDDAMLWKERHVSRTAGMAKIASFLVGGLLFALLIWAGYYVVEPVVSEILVSGWSDLRSHARRELHGFLLGVSVTIYIIWGFGIASAAASGVSSEREGDTWLSLTATPLSGPEILRAKMIGAAWSLRVLAYLLFAIWGFGLVLGAIHPLGVMLCLVEFAVYSWFIVALGTSVSLRSKNSTRALAGTMMILMIVNGGYLFCCIPFRYNSPLIVVGCSPAIFGGSLFNYDMAGQMLGGTPRHTFGPDAAEFIIAGFVNVIGYAAAAVAITTHCFNSFDAAVGRPDRFNRPAPNPQAKPKAASAGGIE